MKNKNKNSKSKNGFIWAGIILGLGVGFYFGTDQAIIVGLFIGLGLGILAKLISEK